MQIEAKDVFQWYNDNIKLVQKVCWKAKYRSDCGKSITFDDLMDHCLDKIVNVFHNFYPDKGTKLSTFVMLSLRFECMKFIERSNRRAKRFPPLHKTYKQIHSQEWDINQAVKYIEEDELSDKIFILIESILLPLELRIYLLRSEGSHFEDIAKEVGFKVGKVQKIYWSVFYRVRKAVCDKYLADYT